MNQNQKELAVAACTLVVVGAAAYGLSRAVSTLQTKLYNRGFAKALTKKNSEK